MLSFGLFKNYKNPIIALSYCTTVYFIYFYEIINVTLDFFIKNNTTNNLMAAMFIFFIL